MKAFAAVDGGWESQLEAWEREALAGLLLQVTTVLRADDDHPAETSADRALRAEAALAREALLPDASEDPEIAVAISARSRDDLRGLKDSRSRDAVAELLAPSGTGGAVRVPAGAEGAWLGALNDARLLLARRLGIDSPEAAEAIHSLADSMPSGSADPQVRERHAAAILYTMLTWWQESLVSGLLGD
ncbi:DUF2017 family protein [Actinomyces gaoshouyii]|uniref:DUF2017 domain-containing protein n=1 Tax=Actinomyces gaoshouyii TaxID=1960083 RepID=A0A8H9HB04_9ACTO|nr:DUF2017 family protein [Actinomyces gaoshouyii]ARD41438.1 hypothetical protein B6G06_02850 [Actinomyces gaoshouyii]GGO99343.1 hypothetical protein GCM10011612_16380 [Actinomyces gaoshouyii]